MHVKYSSIVLALLEMKCPISSTRTWDNPNLLAQLGITNKPPFLYGESVSITSSSKTSRIPKGLSVSKMRSFVKFIHRLRGQPENQRLQFIDKKGGMEEAGRRVWRRWFRSTIQHCLCRRVSSLFAQMGIHPVQVMYYLNCDHIPQDFTQNFVAYSTIVAIEIFGPGTTYWELGQTRCRQGAYKYLNHIVELWLKGTDAAWHRVQTTTLPELRKRARHAIDSLVNSERALRMEDIRTAQESVNEYGKVASQHPTEEIELETYKSILEGIWSGIGKETDRTVHPRVLSQRMTGFAIGWSKNIFKGDLANKTEVEAAWSSFVGFFKELKPVFEESPEWNLVLLKGLRERDWNFVRGKNQFRQERAVD